MKHKWQIDDRCSPVDGRWTGTVIAIRDGKLVVKEDEGFVEVYAMDELVPLGPLDIRGKSVKDEPGAQGPKINPGIPVLDLHAEKLPACRKLPADMILACQLDELRLFLQRMKRDKIPRFRIIHGKGSGVLRAEVIRMLRARGFKNFRDETLDGGSLIVDRY